MALRAQQLPPIDFMSLERIVCVAEHRTARLDNELDALVEKRTRWGVDVPVRVNLNRPQAFHEPLGMFQPEVRGRARRSLLLQEPLQVLGGRPVPTDCLNR